MKRLKRHHRQEDEEDNSSKAADGSIVSGKKARVSRREAGKVMLDVLKPSPTEVVLTLSCIKNAHGAGDGEIEESMAWLKKKCLFWRIPVRAALYVAYCILVCDEAMVV